MIEPIDDDERERLLRELLVERFGPRYPQGLWTKPVGRGGTCCGRPVDCPNALPEPRPKRQPSKRKKTKEA